MKKGIDYTGVGIVFYCHDGEGNYLFHKRSEQCRDEQGSWDCGGGGLKFNERIEDGVTREVREEYGTTPLRIEFFCFNEIFREVEGHPSHWLFFRYRVLVDRERVVNNEPEKHAALGWYPIAKPPSPLHPLIPPALEEYKDLLR